MMTALQHYRKSGASQHRQSQTAPQNKHGNIVGVRLYDRATVRPCDCMTGRFYGWVGGPVQRTCNSAVAPANPQLCSVALLLPLRSHLSCTHISAAILPDNSNTPPDLTRPHPTGFHRRIGRNIRPPETIHPTQALGIYPTIPSAIWYII